MWIWKLLIIKSNLKGTSFIIGNLAYNNVKGFINYRAMQDLKELYSNYDFQNHSFVLIIYLKKIFII